MFWRLDLWKLEHATANLVLAIMSVLAAAVAAVAALGAWTAARQASRAAVTLTAIERHRWHAELTPKFEARCSVTAGDRTMLRVALVGPPGLDRLDRVTVTIRDDIRGRVPVTAGGPTAEQIARQVWGPYRFVRGVDGADENGRGVAPVELLLGDWRPFSLERTLPPPWGGGDSDRWRQQYADQPVRLTITCQRQGREPWTVPLEVGVDHDG